MKCRYCGHKIPEGMLYCEVCGNEVRIVPDYNPLDDMLSEQIKVSIDGDGNEDYLVYDESRFQTRATSAPGNTGRNTGNTGRVNANRMRNGNTGRTNTNRMRNGNTGQMNKEARRRQAEKKKAKLRKKRRKVLLLLSLILAIIVAMGVLLYQTSYNGIVNKAQKAVQSQEYAKAEEYFKKAIAKSPERSEAYTGLSKVYMNQGDVNSAEIVFTDAIAKYPKSVDLYKACIEFYLESEDVFKIPLLLDDAEDSVTEALDKYVVSKPQFSLDAEEIFEDVQQLTLSSDGMLIYYTTDGSDPTLKSKKYTEPIQISEGETTIKAFCINKEGVPSLTVEKIYTVELPIEEAPVVSPSTGQYEEATKIEIKVPDGYDAYYTTDGKDPTTSSKKYTGPIDMPEGETLFKAVLVTGDGRLSGITTRSYMLDISE